MIVVAVGLTFVFGFLIASFASSDDGPVLDPATAGGAAQQLQQYADHNLPVDEQQNSFIEAFEDFILKHGKEYATREERDTVRNLLFNNLLFINLITPKTSHIR